MMGSSSCNAADLLKEIFLLMYYKDVILRNPGPPKMRRTEEAQNSIYITQDIIKEIFLRLPLKSLAKFKTVSKEWRWILESKTFNDLHLSNQKSGKSRRKILAGYKCDCCDRPNLSPVAGDEEFVYLHCDTSRPSMSCDGLVCIPEPGWVNVLNPPTGELRRFPSGPDPVPCPIASLDRHVPELWFNYFPGNWAMGFGRDKVTGRYKVVRMCFDPVECDVLAVETGEWRKLRAPPPYEVQSGRRSACVNGSIYWLEVAFYVGYKILGFDLHTEEFHDVKSLPRPYLSTGTAQILNLDDRLAISITMQRQQKLEIWCMDSEEERWSKAYSICLAGVAPTEPGYVWWYTPVMVSEEGNVLISDNNKGLFKHYPQTNVTRRLASPSTCCVISPYLENLVRL
ncbi:unnamed protein product [Thlaspi arvense]|uniref:F-box domain-containing protein n=1 Tax=Thlaspi arvense TaxID=13288 RepID=A0AAU9S4H1_THLAR|nr:unnamed protein product [Thlaspi arvense]